MIKELAHFSQTLDADFKKSAMKPKEGLHILLGFSEADGIIELNEKPVLYEIYSKKMSEESEFIEQCKLKSTNAWCVNTNKCFDLPTKAIHTCSPVMIAFKREHIEGGKKYAINEQKKKSQVDERFATYFNKSFDLISDEASKQLYVLFQNFFTSGQYKTVLKEIEQDFLFKREEINSQIERLKDLLLTENDKSKKEDLKSDIKEVERTLIEYKELDDSDYLAFYLDVPLESYVAPHSVYLADKLFNTDKYNVSREKENESVLLGTSDFMNSFNSNMPFLTHQTATFEISGRISNIEAKALYQFEEVLKGKVLPNPLPIFIFSDEIQNRSVAIIKKEGYRVGYKEIIEKLFDDTEIKSQIGNYYLLNWANTKDGIVFNDFDYVSKFEYNFPVTVQNHFGKGSTQELYTIFDFQNNLLPTIFNNSLIVKTKGGGVLQKYFDDIEEKYCKSALNYTLILKYRRAFYEFIYKSRRSAVTQGMFHDIMKTSILEDIRLDEVKNGNHQERFNIQNKLNIWFSLYEQFDIFKNKTDQTMASKLTDYRQMMTDLVNGNKELSEISNEGFMFAAGQVIEYLRSKSKSGDTSYKLLEPYLQKISAKELKRVIANDFARYKHENFSRNFEKVASMVLTYETDTNIKEYLPELLAGIFSDNQLFSNKVKETPTE